MNEQNNKNDFPDYVYNQRVFYIDSDGVNRKARVLRVVCGKTTYIDLNIREEADPKRVFVRSDNYLSDSDEYDFESEDDNDDTNEEDSTDEESDEEEC